MTRLHAFRALLSLGVAGAIGLPAFPRVARGEATAPAAAPEWTPAEIARGYVAFAHTPLQVLLPGRSPHSNQRPPEGIGPEYVPGREALGGPVRCALTRGERHSVQIGIRALSRDVTNLRLELDTDLDARIFRGIDEATCQMLLAYSNPVVPEMHAACLDESSAVAKVAGGTTAFFWITVHARPDATPGVHRGKIRLQADGGAPLEMDFEVEVRPFALPRARIAYAPFYYFEWGTDMGPPKFAQTDAWLEAIYRDMAEHSHTSLIGAGYNVPGALVDFTSLPPKDNRSFNFLLPLAQSVGLISPDIPIIHFAHNLKQLPQKEGDFTLERQNAALAWYEQERRRQGWPELVAYGRDEPHYPNPDLRQHFGALREVGMRLGVAMFAPAAYGLGDVHDIWIVRSGEISREMVAEARRQGAEVWTYHCDAMSNRPLYERHYAGLYVWAYELRGHTTWHYYAQEDFKLVWMREGDTRPMPTAGWEMRRAGVDDYRYLQLLEQSVAASPDRVAAAEASAWLADLRERVLSRDFHRIALPSDPLEIEEYEQMRATASKFIERLGVADSAPRAPRPTRLKDEARLLRQATQEECLAALASPDSATRRAAAWALAERGPDAATATTALQPLLADAETRIPAIRALEAIGPAAQTAVPKLAELQQHPDAFVRLAASIALKAIDPQPAGESSAAK